MSILTICQSVAVRSSIAKPSAIVGVESQSEMLLLEILKETVADLVRAFPWEALRREHTFTTVAAETQTGGFPSDFSRMIPNTIWNRTNQRRLIGPFSPNEWQRTKASNTGYVFDQYTVRDGAMLIFPVPDAGDTVAFEYITANWYTASDGTTEKSAISADTDLTVLNEELVKLHMIWRAREAAGLEFASFQFKAEAFRVQLQAQEKGPPRTIDLDPGRMGDISAGAAVPEGSWDL